MQKQLNRRQAAELERIKKESDRKLEALKRAMAQIHIAIEAAKKARDAYKETGQVLQDFVEQVSAELNEDYTKAFRGDEAKQEAFDETPEGEAHATWRAAWEDSGVELDFNLDLESVEVPEVYEHETVSDQLDSLPFQVEG